MSRKEQSENAVIIFIDKMTLTSTLIKKKIIKQITLVTKMLGIFVVKY